MNRCRAVNRKDANPGKAEMQDDRSWKVMGSDPGADKGFFMLNIG